MDTRLVQTMVIAMNSAAVGVHRVHRRLIRFWSTHDPRPRVLRHPPRYRPPLRAGAVDPARARGRRARRHPRRHPRRDARDGLFGLAVPRSTADWASRWKRKCGFRWSCARPRPPSAPSRAPTTASARRASSSTAQKSRSAGISAHGERRDHRLVRAHRARRGSDAGSLTTRATRDGDWYVLNGVKRYITNAPRPASSP